MLVQFCQHRQKPSLCSSRLLDSLSPPGTAFPASGYDFPARMAQCMQALGSSRKPFPLQWMCLCLGTQLLFVSLSFPCCQQWPWECWLPGRPSVTPLCHCSAEQPLMGHRTFAAGTFLISCCSASLKFLISPRARGIVQRGLRVLPGILQWCLLVL